MEKGWELVELHGPRGLIFAWEQVIPRSEKPICPPKKLNTSA